MCKVTNHISLSYIILLLNMLIKQCLQILSSVSLNDEQRNKLFRNSILFTVLCPLSELELLCKNYLKVTCIFDNNISIIFPHIINNK